MSDQVKEAPEKCQECKAEPAREPHTCPYLKDINGDFTMLCNCCEECEKDCLLAI